MLIVVYSMLQSRSREEESVSPRPGRKVTHMEEEKRRSWPDRGRAVSFGNSDEARPRIAFQPSGEDGTMK